MNIRKKLNLGFMSLSAMLIFLGLIGVTLVNHLSSSVHIAMDEQVSAKDTLAQIRFISSDTVITSQNYL